MTVGSATRGVFLCSSELKPDFTLCQLSGGLLTRHSWNNMSDCDNCHDIYW